MVDFTVAIPTYNGATRLGAVLERLREQINTENFSWEVIVIDNNSKDNTAKVVREYQSNWPQAYPLKYIFEAEQGAAFARNRAVAEAKANLIGFLDDDNLPESDWVASACEFAQAHPKAGAYGSQVKGNYEIEPPKNFQKVAGFLGISNRGNAPHRYEPHTRMLPPGAGLVVRRQAWLANVPQRLVLNHIGKEEGLASEDLEALLYIQKAGWEIWYNSEMRVYHEIPSWRLEKRYLISVARCVGLSRHHLRMVRLKDWQKPIFIPIYLVNDLRRLITYWIKYRSEIKKDAIAACELELLRCSLISPFFLWKKQYLKSRSVSKLSQKKQTDLRIEKTVISCKSR